MGLWELHLRKCQRSITENFSREVLINDGCFGHEAERIDNLESPRQQDEGERRAKSESNEPRTKLEANSEEKVVQGGGGG